MGMGRQGGTQPGMWVATTELPRSPGHTFYEKLNQLLAEAGSIGLEELCAPVLRRGHRPAEHSAGLYFRMLFVGYFEGLTAQRGIAWRCGDSLSLRTSGLGGHRGDAGPFEPDPGSSAPAGGGARAGVSVGAGSRGGQGRAAGQGAGDRRDDAGGQRGDEVDGAPGSGEK